MNIKDILSCKQVFVLTTLLLASVTKQFSM
jgi:hypothetical protein